MRVWVCGYEWVQPTSIHSALLLLSSNYHSRSVDPTKIEKWNVRRVKRGRVSYVGVLKVEIRKTSMENFLRETLTKYCQSLFTTQRNLEDLLTFPSIDIVAISTQNGGDTIPCLLHVRTCCDYKYSRHIPSKNSSRFLWACFDFLFSVFRYCFLSTQLHQLFHML